MPTKGKWLLALLALLIPGTIALASVSYSSDLAVSNNTTTAYPQLGVTSSANVTLLVANGFITSTGLDTRVQNSGSDLPWMMASDRVTFAVPVPANSTNTYQFVTGQTAATSMQIVPGYGGYVTTNDTAALELSNNGTVSFSGYVDTTVVNSVIAQKVGAFQIATGNVTGNVTASIFDAISQPVKTSNLSLYTGASTRAGQRIDSFTAKTIVSANFTLAKAGSPTGTGNVTVRSVSGDTLLGVLGTLDVSTLTGSYVNHQFNTTPVIVPATQDIRIQFEYNGGDIANQVMPGLNAANTVTGMTTYYGGAYTDNAAWDTTFAVTWATSISISGVPSGEYDIVLYLDSTNMWMVISE
jgi:hypothetical protein